MRIYQEGFELDAAFINENGSVDFLPVSRWVEVGGRSYFVSTNTFDIHTNPNGDGGTQSIGMGGYSPATDDRHMHSPGLPFDLRYAWTGYAARSPIAQPDFQFGFSHLAGGVSKLAKHIDIQTDFAGIVSIRNGGVVVASSVTPLTPSYHWYAVEYFLDEINGFVNVWVDDIFWVSFSGNTVGSDLSTLGYWDNLQVSFGENTSVDDIVVNAATISYNSGISTPTLGATVTGGTSGSSAVITNYQEPTVTGEGFVVLHPIGTTAPAGFIFGETLSDGFGWTATANQKDIDLNGLDKNSGRPPENIIILIRPDQDVSAGLIGSDGNSINNYQQVDDDPFGDTLNYNEGTLVGQEDVYRLADLPFSPATIEAVEVVTYATRAAGISGIEMAVDPGLGTTYGASKPTGSGGSFAKGNEIFDINPDTGLPWTESDVNATDVGVRLG